MTNSDIVERLNSIDAACTQKTFLHSPDWRKGREIVQAAITEIVRLRSELATEKEESASYHRFWIEARDEAAKLRAELESSNSNHREMAKRMEDIERETIERCAKVAENFNAAGVPIAAAIRALLPARSGGE